jgi:hypothetical protein
MRGDNIKCILLVGVMHRDATEKKWLEHTIHTHKMEAILQGELFIMYPYHTLGAV